MSQRTDFALELLEDASNIIMPYYQSELILDKKNDGSLVTKADVETEKYIRAEIKKYFPEDNIFGEELENEIGRENAYTWTIDPIDGTFSFARGVPFFGTMIGILKNNEIVFGGVYFPALDEMIYALKGEGTFWKKAGVDDFLKIELDKKAEDKRLIVGLTAKEYFTTELGKKCLKKYEDNDSLFRTWGDCYGFCLLATGRIDVMLEPICYIWDIVPLKIIIEEAGGIVESGPIILNNEKNYLFASIN